MSSLTNSVPLSLVKIDGTPWRQMMSSWMKTAMPWASASSKARASMYLVKWSMARTMYLFPEEVVCRGPITSIPTWKNGSGTLVIGSRGARPDRFCLF